MHAAQFQFKRCLKEGAAQHQGGAVYECARKGELCNIKIQCEGREFCRTPLKEKIEKREKGK